MHFWGWVGAKWVEVEAQRTGGGVKSFLGAGILQGRWQLVVDFFVDLLVEVNLFWQGWNSMQGGFVDFFLQATDLLLHRCWWCTAGVVLDCWVDFC